MAEGFICRAVRLLCLHLAPGLQGVYTFVAQATKVVARVKICYHLLKPATGSAVCHKQITCRIKGTQIPNLVCKCVCSTNLSAGHVLYLASWPSQERTTLKAGS